MGACAVLPDPRRMPAKATERAPADLLRRRERFHAKQPRPAKREPCERGGCGGLRPPHSTPRFPLAAALLSALLPALASAQRVPRSVAVSIVRPSGSPLDLPLVAGVEDALASRRVSVLRVETLRGRLAALFSSRPTRAPLELTAARALELEARFGEAAQHYAAAVGALIDDPRTLPEPRRIAEAELARGAAALQEGDEATALSAMQAALGWVEDLQADPTFSPEARAVLARARELGPTPPPQPSREVLAAATKAARARFLVYSAAGGPTSSRTIRVIVTERGRVLLDERRSITGLRPEVAARQAAERISARVATRIRLPPPPRPFWASPWFWSGVGAVVTGATAATLYLTATPQMDFELDR